jgi:hypothetical protein
MVARAVNDIYSGCSYWMLLDNTLAAADSSRLQKPCMLLQHVMELLIDAKAWWLAEARLRERWLHTRYLSGHVSVTRESSPSNAAAAADDCKIDTASSGGGIALQLDSPGTGVGRRAADSQSCAAILRYLPRRLAEMTTRHSQSRKAIIS